MKKVITTFLAAVLIAGVAISQQATEKCKSLTKAGNICRGKAKKSGYCIAHDPSTPKCGAKKKDGNTCRMTVKNVGTKCRHHAN